MSPENVIPFQKVQQRPDNSGITFQELAPDLGIRFLEGCYDGFLLDTL